MFRCFVRETQVTNKRNNIQDWIENYQTTDSYDIGNAQLNWLSSREEWQLILPNGEIHYESSGCGVGDLLDLVSDEDIDNYYPQISDNYSDEALMDQAWQMACVQEGYDDGEVPDWAIQMVSDTQQEIYNSLVETAEWNLLYAMI